MPQRVSGFFIAVENGVAVLCDTNIVASECSSASAVTEL